MFDRSLAAAGVLFVVYPGAEAFALHALAGTPDLTVVAVGRVGLVFAVGAVLYLPQFFADPTLRIAHGVLLAIGCLVLATRVDEKARVSAG